MAKKIRLTEEEEVVEMLKREGFKELTKEELKKPQYRSIYKLPECFEPRSKKVTRGKNKG
jgi:hypothetical protein